MSTNLDDEEGYMCHPRRLAVFGVCAIAIAAALALPSHPRAAVAITGDLVISVGPAPVAWYEDVTVSAGSQSLVVSGDLTISGPVACTEHDQCASRYCGDAGNCALAPPRITITGVENGELANAVPVQLCYSATDPYLTSHEGTLDGIPFTGCATATSDGIHSVTVTATNSAGSTASSQMTFVIDRTPPAVDFAHPVPGSSVHTQAVAVSVMAADAWGVADVRLNGAPMTLSAEGYYRAGATLEMGANTLTVTATDVAGNARTSTWTVNRVPPPVLVGMAVSSVTSSWRAGSTGRLAAWGSFSDGTAQNVTSEATWTSSDQAVARIVSPGVIEAVARGSVTITASRNGVWGATTLGVSAGSSQLALFVTAPVQRFETVDSNLSVQGTVVGGRPGYSVSVDGTAVYVAPTGEFATMVALPVGSMDILVEATDSTGDTVSRVISGRRLPASSAAVPQPTVARNRAPGRIRYLHDEAGNLIQVIDTFTDPSNCGDLGARCIVPAGTAACQEGRCGVVQSGQFVDVYFDPSNCGAPGHVCSVPENGEAACDHGVCRATCSYGFVWTGAGCADLTTDPQHCGRVDGDCHEPGLGDPSAICRKGTCVVPATPVVSSVNGVAAPGLAFRSPMWNGIVIQGTGLENVTEVYLEDLGSDSDASGLQRAPSSTGLSIAVPVPFWKTRTSIVIPHAALQHLFDRADLVPAFRWREWYRVSLAAQNGSWLDPDELDTVVTAAVPVSLDDHAPAARPAPAITGAASLRVRRGTPIAVGDMPTLYNPATGFLSLYSPESDLLSDPPSASRCPGRADPAVGPPPVAVLAYNDVLMTEYPVYGVTHGGVYIRAGLDLDGVDRVQRTWVPRSFRDPSGQVFDVTLVYAESGWGSVFVDLRNDRSQDPCYAGTMQVPLGPLGGVIARGRNLAGDGTVTLAAPVGQHRPGDLSSAAFLDDRIVVRPLSIIEDRVIERPLVGIEDGYAFLEFDSARGIAATPWPLRWLEAPQITSIGPASFVTYDHVMTIAGDHFSEITDVSFSWRFSREHLTPSASDPPGPGEYFVLDCHHVKVNVAHGGTTVPRRLSSACLACGSYVEKFPGARTFTIANALGSSSMEVSALDPGSTPVSADPPASACPPCPRPRSDPPSGGGSGSGDVRETPTWPQLNPRIPPGGCNVTNTLGACP